MTLNLGWWQPAGAAWGSGRLEMTEPSSQSSGWAHRAWTSTFPSQALLSWDRQWEGASWKCWLSCSQGPHVFIIGVFCCSLFTLSQSWGVRGAWAHPQTMEGTLKQTHLVRKWGWGNPVPRASFSVSSNNTRRLTDIKYTPLHSGVSILPSSLLREHPFSLVPECSLHLKNVPIDAVAGQTQSFSSLHICESCVHLLNNQIQGTH